MVTRQCWQGPRAPGSCRQSTPRVQKAPSSCSSSSLPLLSAPAAVRRARRCRPSGSRYWDLLGELAPWPLVTVCSPGMHAHLQTLCCPAAPQVAVGPRRSSDWRAAVMPAPCDLRTQGATQRRSQERQRSGVRPERLGRPLGVVQAAAPVLRPLRAASDDELAGTSGLPRPGCCPGCLAPYSGPRTAWKAAQKNGALVSLTAISLTWAARRASSTLLP